MFREALMEMPLATLVGCSEPEQKIGTDGK